MLPSMIKALMPKYLLNVKNGLSCRTREEFNAAKEAFGLGEEWIFIPHKGAVCGRRFNKIVVILGTNYILTETLAQWIENLECRLPPNEKVIIL